MAFRFVSCLHFPRASPADTTHAWLIVSFIFKVRFSQFLIVKYSSPILILSNYFSCDKNSLTSPGKSPRSKNHSCVSRALCTSPTVILVQEHLFLDTEFPQGLFPTRLFSLFTLTSRSFGSWAKQREPCRWRRNTPTASDVGELPDDLEKAPVLLCSDILSKLEKSRQKIIQWLSPSLEPERKLTLKFYHGTIAWKTPEKRDSNTRLG